MKKTKKTILPEPHIKISVHFEDINKHLGGNALNARIVAFTDRYAAAMNDLLLILQQQKYCQCPVKKISDCALFTHKEDILYVCYNCKLIIQAEDKDLLEKIRRWENDWANN